MPARIIALVPTFVAPSQSILFYILTYMRHPPIVGKDTWEAVQLEKERRKDFAARCQIQKIDYATDEHPFAGRVICGCCERAYGRKVWNSTDEQLRRIIWRCNNKYVAKGAKGCDSWHIDDGVLYKTFINTTT